MKTEKVFGVSNELIASYVERSEVDDAFNEALSLNRHIVIYGSSKQGKTYLLAKHLTKEQIVKVECSPGSDTVDLYKSVLRQLDVEIETGGTRSSGLKGSAKISANFKVKIPFFGSGGAGTEVSASEANKKEKQYKLVDYNLGLAQDVSEIFQAIENDRYIVLENFHYLSEPIQKKIAFDLRVFQDYSINFIILGIWRERNRLTQYNGDLQDRLIEIPVEPWKREDLIRITKKGSECLNVDMTKVEEKILNASFDSVGVFQELCKTVCLKQEIRETVKKSIVIKPQVLKESIDAKVEDYSNRHVRALESFAVSSRKKPKNGLLPLFIPYYFVKILMGLDFHELISGIKRNYLHEQIIIKHHRPDDVRPSDMSNFLYNIVNYQISHNINPPLFDYDISIQTLKVIDSTLYFFLRYADKKKIFESVPNPVAEKPVL